MTPSKIPNFAYLEAASEWFAILADESVSEKDRLAWQEWLNQDVENYKAWQQVESVGMMFSAFEDKKAKQSMHHVLENQDVRNASRRQFMKGIMGLTGVAALGWFGWENTTLPKMASVWTADFHTAVGQAVTYELEDGSIVWLNTDTSINRDYSPAVRSLSLVSGEILVQTMPTMESRDFSVSCSLGTVSSGTKGAQFCLRHLSNNTAILAVYEGSVSIEPLDGRTVEVIRAGQEVMFTTSSVNEVQSVSAQYRSWIDGLLVVDNMLLSEFFAEIGRYRYGYVNFDIDVSDLRITGTYPIHDVSIIFTMLENSLPLKIQQPMPWWASISHA